MQFAGFLLLPFLSCQLLAQGNIPTEGSANPLGVFDFDFRGRTPAEKIKSIGGLGFEGIAMFFNGDNDIAKLEKYQAADPDLRFIAGLVVNNHTGRLNIPQMERLIAKLSETDATLWLIMKGSPDDEKSVVKRIREIADMAAKKKVPVCLYPHDGDVHTYKTAEDALVYLEKANRPNLSLSVHLCHELRGGNGKRLAEVITKVRPYLMLASISGANHEVTPGNPDWSDTIKPLSEGDFDTTVFLRALKNAGYEGSIILHTFGLSKKPSNYHAESIKAYRKLWEKIEKAAN
jgi:sugar phosphate isomerase/epimerase